MRKIILPLIILSLLFGAVGFAQEADLPDPGLTPDSPFYFLDILGEKIGMFFTFGAEKKAEKALKYAEEKLAEVKAMAEENKVEALEKANQKYYEYLDLTIGKVQEAAEKGRNFKELKILLPEKSLKHLETLSDWYEKVPKEAKLGIEKAIETSRRVLRLKAEREPWEKLTPSLPENISEEKRKEMLERLEKITYLYPSEAIAKLDFSFSKTEIKALENLEVKLILENVGKKSFPEGEYLLYFSRKGEKKPEEGKGDFFGIKGPIEPGKLIERITGEPVGLGSVPGKYTYEGDEIRSGAHVFELSFEKLITEKPLKGKIIKTLKKEINLTFVPVEGKIEIEKPKIELPVELSEKTRKALSICEKIESGTTHPRETPRRYICMATVLNDPGYCELLHEYYQSDCYLNVIDWVIRDPAICEKIKKSENRKTCQDLANKGCSIVLTHRDYCYAEEAAIKRDASICERIEYFGGRATCKAIISRDVTFCRRTETEDCYQKLALLTGNEKVCDELRKREDIKSIRDLEEEVSKCIKMAKREIRDCFIKPGTGIDCDMIPAVVADPSLCEQLGVYKDTCYFSVALRIADLLPLEAMLLP